MTEDLQSKGAKRWLEPTELKAFLIASVTVGLLSPYAMVLDWLRHPFSHLSVVIPYLVFIVPVVWIFTALIAGPIYLHLPASRRSQLLPLLLSGFAAGILSSFALALLMHANFSEIDGVVLARNNLPSFAGWVLLLKQSLAMGIVGSVGGSMMWAVLRMSTHRRDH